MKDFRNFYSVEIKFAPVFQLFIFSPLTHHLLDYDNKINTKPSAAAKSPQENRVKFKNLLDLVLCVCCVGGWVGV